MNVVCIFVFGDAGFDVFVDEFSVLEDQSRFHVDIKFDSVFFFVTVTHCVLTTVILIIFISDNFFRFVLFEVLLALLHHNASLKHFHFKHWLVSVRKLFLDAFDKLLVDAFLLTIFYNLYGLVLKWYRIY